MLWMIAAKRRIKPDPVVIQVVIGLITAKLMGSRTSSPREIPRAVLSLMITSDSPEERTSMGTVNGIFDSAAMVMGSICSTTIRLLLEEITNLIVRSLVRSLMSVNGRRSL